MPRLALKVDVDSLPGCLDGVPRLLALFESYSVKATFLFCTGYGADSGPSLLPRALGAARRALGIERPLMVGEAADVLRSTRDAGHELGVRAFDHRAWIKQVVNADAAWTRECMSRAVASFESVLGARPSLHAAPSWQLNAHVLATEEALGFAYSSDARGRYAFYPELLGQRSKTVQIPTTLPTLGELLNSGVGAEKVHEQVFAESQQLLPHGHLFTANADAEGGALLEVMEKLLIMWQGSQMEIGTLADTYGALEPAQLPVHRIGWGQVPGRAGHLAMQSLKLADSAEA